MGPATERAPQFHGGKASGILVSTVQLSHRTKLNQEKGRVGTPKLTSSMPVNRSGQGKEWTIIDTFFSKANRRRDVLNRGRETE